MEINKCHISPPYGWCLIGFFLLYYALTDGADLGIGMLTLFTRDWEEKNEMMQSIHTIWHGNQTWLVILGGMLFGAFPLFLFHCPLRSLYSLYPDAVRLDFSRGGF